MRAFRFWPFISNGEEIGASGQRGSRLSHHVRGRIGQLALALFLLAFVIAIYWLTGLELARIWDRDQNYSHGYAVLPASLVLACVAWRRRGSMVRSFASPNGVWLALFEVILGLVLHLLAWLAGILILDVASLIVVMCGLTLLLGGREAYWRYRFPIMFLIFMAPLPTAWYQPIALAMQQLVSSISAHLFEATGTAVYREGYLILLPGYTLEVGEACSGLRQLTAILALALAIGYLSGRGNAHRWALALLAAPIAIATNCLRVIMTGVILICFGPDWADGFFHMLEGLAIVGLSAALIVAADWCLPIIVGGVIVLPGEATTDSVELG